jgi:hypothetical protein
MRGLNKKGAEIFFENFIHQLAKRPDVCISFKSNLADEEKYLSNIDNKETAKKIKEFDKNKPLEKRALFCKYVLP